MVTSYARNGVFLLLTLDWSDFYPDVKIIKMAPVIGKIDQNQNHEIPVFFLTPATVLQTSNDAPKWLTYMTKWLSESQKLLSLLQCGTSWQATCLTKVLCNLNTGSLQLRWKLRHGCLSASTFGLLLVDADIILRFSSKVASLYQVQRSKKAENSSDCVYQGI